MEIERNLEIVKTVDGDVRLIKYVGEPGTPEHRVLFEHTWTRTDWEWLNDKVIHLEYVESPPAPEPEAVPDPAPRAPKPAPQPVNDNDPAPRARRAAKPAPPGPSGDHPRARA